MQDLHIIIVEHWILKQYIFVNKLISNVFKHVSFELRGHGFKHVSFESDCQQLVQILHSSKSWPALEPELDDIESLRISFIFFSLSFIPRSLNIRADTLAKEARSRELNFKFVDVLAPQQLAPEASMLGPV